MTFGVQVSFHHGCWSKKRHQIVNSGIYAAEARVVQRVALGRGEGEASAACLGEGAAGAAAGLGEEAFGFGETAFGLGEATGALAGFLAAPFEDAKAKNISTTTEATKLTTTDTLCSAVRPSMAPSGATSLEISACSVL